MSYLDALLADTEEVRYQARQHPFVFASRIVGETIIVAILAATVTFILSRTSGSWASATPWLSILLGLIAIVVVASIVYDFMRWRTEQFVLTDRRVIHLRGILNKSTVDSSLDKINDIQMRQSFFGRMFDFGDLDIQTASEEGSNFFSQIKSPLEFKRAILNAKADQDNAAKIYFDTMPEPFQHALGAAAPLSRLSQQEIEEQLYRLNELHQKNLITDEDFTAKKRDILSRM